MAIAIAPTTLVNATAEPTLKSIPPEIRVLNPKGNRELILLVDDETEIAELASTMLTDEGYRVILARDGFEALKIYQQVGNQIDEFTRQGSEKVTGAVLTMLLALLLLALMYYYLRTTRRAGREAEE